MTHFLRFASCAAALTALCVFSGCNSGDSGGSGGGGGSTSGGSTSGSGGSTSGGGGASSSSEKVEIGANPDGGWGGLSLTFTYGGDVPTQPAVNVTKDVEYCGTFDLVQEWRIVNPENKGLSNIFIYLLKKDSDTVPIADSYAASAEEPIEIDNFQCRFNPHGLTIRTGQPVVIGNDDIVGHNTKGEPRANTPFNVNVAANDQVPIDSFTKSERMPFPISCSIHPWMKGHVLVQDHPYMAVSDVDGNILIEDLPAGTWEFQVWQEDIGFVSDVTLDGESTTWNRGRFTVTIEPDTTTEMGEVVIPAASFKSN